MIGFLTQSEGWRYPSDSLGVLAIGLKFSEVMHSNTKRIAKYKMAMLSHFCVFQETLKFSMIGFFDWVWATTLPL